MIDVTRQELQTSFHRHFRTYSSGIPKTHSHLLLLFYAVECGLKVYIMRQSPKIKTTADLNDDPEMRKIKTHDLNYLLHRAGYGSKGITKTKYRNLQGVNDLRASSDVLHELWRYGVDGNHADIEAVRSKLVPLQTTLIFFCSRRIRSSLVFLLRQRRYAWRACASSG